MSNTGGPFFFINVAQLGSTNGGVFSGYNTLGDNVTSVTNLSGSLAVTPSWTAGTVVAGRSALMSTAGNVGSGGFSTGTKPAAEPSGGDAYVAFTSVGGSYVSGTWTLAISTIATTATYNGTAHFNFRVWVAPQPNGQTSQGADVFTELTSGATSTGTFSNLTTSTPQIVTGTFNPGAKSFGSSVFVFVQIALVIDTAGTNSTARVTIQGGSNSKLTPQTFTPNALWRKCSGGQSFTTLTPSMVVALAAAAGDALLVYLLRTPNTALNDGDITAGPTDTSGNSYGASVVTARGDTNGLRTTGYVCTNVAAAAAGSNTISFTLGSPDTGSTIEEYCWELIGSTGGAGTISVGTTASNNDGGGQATTLSGSLTLGASTLLCIFATGQSSNFRSTTGDVVHQDTAANTVFAEQWFSSATTYSYSWSQSPTNGCQLLFIPLVGPVSVPTGLSAWFPSSLPLLSKSAASLLSFSAVAPQTTSAAPTQAPASFPDRVDRRSLPAAEHPSFAWTPLDRPAGLSVALFQDAIDRRVMLSAEQLASTTEPPQPERTQNEAPGLYPDAIDRRLYPSANQHVQATSEPPAIERTTPLDTGIYPAWIARAVLPVSVPLFATSEPPEPERTSKVAPSSYPDWIARALFVPAEQQSETSQPPFTDRTSPIAAGVYPDWLQRREFAVVEQWASPPIAPMPERAAPVAMALFQDAISRTSYATGAFAGGVSAANFSQQDRPSPVCSVVFQDWIPRAVLPTAEHLSATLEPALTERAAVPTYANYPDWIARLSFSAAEQLTVTDQPPVLIANPVPTQAPWSYPDRIDPRPGLHAPLQLAATSEPPLITLNPLITYASAIFQDSIARATFIASEQPQPASVPERSQPFGSSFDAWIARATLPNATQLVVTDQPPLFAGAGTVPLVSHPDWIPRIVYAASEQQFGAPVIEPERSAPMAGASHPDWIARLAYAAAEQPFATSEPPVIERNVHPAPADYPTWIARAMFIAAEQLPATTEPPLPQANPVPLPIGGFPASIARLAFLAANQQFAGAPVAPERTTLLASTAYPDRVDGRAMAAAEHIASTSQPAVVPSSGASAVYPDRVDRLVFGAHEQLTATAEPANVERTAPEATAWYPERIDSRWLTVACQMAATSEPPLPQPNVVPTISTFSFPDFVFWPVPPTLGFVGSPAIWFAEAPKRHPRITPTMLSVGTVRRHVIIFPRG